MCYFKQPILNLREIQRSDNQVPITFSVSMPMWNYVPNAELGICVVESDKDITVRSLSTKIEVKKSESDNLLHFQIETLYPTLKNIKYFYYLAILHQVKSERLLLTDHLRSLDESRLRANNKIFDGLVLFGDEETISNLELERLKAKTISSLLGTEILWRGPDKNFDFINNLTWIYESADDSYKSYFLEVLYQSP